MKASPRFRESTAYIRLRHQPPQIKYPLLALQIVANPQAYDAAPLNVKEEVLHSPTRLLCTALHYNKATAKYATITSEIT